MNDVIELLHEATTLTKADLISVCLGGFILGCFVSGSIQALIEFIVDKVKEKKKDE